MNDSQKTEIRVESQEEAKDTSGPRGTYGCACVSRDARECVLMREGYRGDDAGYYDTCECLCHQWSDDDDEYH